MESNLLTFLSLILGCIGAFFVLGYGHWYIYAIISIILKPKKFPPAKKLHKYGYIISARNEEAVIAELIESIYSQNYPRENMQVFVVADNCTDNTALRAREAGAVVYERFNKEKVGKGYALQTLVGQMLQEGVFDDYKGFFVFDADNLLDKDFTLRMNDAIDNGARIAVGLRNTKNWNDNWISACNGLYFIRESYQLNHARNVLKSDSFVQGTGWYMESDIMKKEGGWDYTCMSEDTEFSVAQILKGERIVSCTDAVFYDDQVTTWSQSWKQRSRWITGTKQVWEMNYPALLKNLFSKRFLVFWDCICVSLGGSYLSAFGTISCALSMIVVMLTMFPSPAMLVIPFSFLFSLYINFFFSSTFSLFFAFDKIPLPLYKKVMYTLIFPLFMLSYMLIGFYISFVNKEVKWEPIIHKSSKKTEADCCNKK